MAIWAGHLQPPPAENIKYINVMVQNKVPEGIYANCNYADYALCPLVEFRKYM